MDGLAFLLIAAAALVTGKAQSEPVGLIVVKADAAVVAIDPVADERRLISLPSLQYALTVRPKCAAGMRAEAISVSIADTRRTYSGSEIDEQPLVEVSLEIPRQQIGPIAIQEFCRSDQNYDDQGMLRIKDVFTAQLSLRCADESARSIIYASQPLDVALECRRQHGETNASGDQDTSSSSPR